MQIWQIPPKYLDTETLLNQQAAIVMFLDAKKLDYDGWDGYLLCLLHLSERELIRRGIDCILFAKNYNPHDFDFYKRPTVDAVMQTVVRLKEHWRDKLNNNSILEHFDILSNATPDEIYAEQAWILELQYKELFV